MKSYEMVETLSQKSHVTLEQAKDALEKSNWDMLDAAIYLERTGAANSNRADGTPNGVSYSTSPQNNNPQQMPFGANPQYGNPGQNGGQYVNPPYNGSQCGNAQYGSGQYGNPQYGNAQYGNAGQGKSFGASINEWLNKAAGVIEKIIGNGVENSFVVSKNGNQIIQIPVLVFIILLLGIFPMSVILLVVGLFFDFKYSFIGKDMKDISVNDMMNSASNAADKIKNDFQSGMNDINLDKK